MGLLSALDFHTHGMAGDFTEVEYRLYSWGEIYPPFIGNREHDEAARYILRDFPFKLFSSSTPYDTLPQKLCLTFRATCEIRKDKKEYQGSGVFSEEIAKEFAAFLSVVTRRRVFAGRQTRCDGLPIEQEADLYQRSHVQERQRLKEIDPKEIYHLLENIQAMDRCIANGFVLAMRLYHSAVEMMYSEPEFSYLFLIMSLETISSIIYKKEEVMPSDDGDMNSELGQFLDSKYKGWRELCDVSNPESKTKLTRVLLTKEYFDRRKLQKLVNDYLPERFWTETEDEAKPDYLKYMIEGSGQELISHSDITIDDWEKIKKENLTRVIRDIYVARSNFIHEGKRLPRSIVLGHFRLLPAPALGEIMDTLSEGQPKRSLPIPPLFTFERLVSYSMVEFLRKQHGEGYAN